MSGLRTGAICVAITFSIVAWALTIASLTTCSWIYIEGTIPLQVSLSLVLSLGPPPPVTHSLTPIPSAPPSPPLSTPSGSTTAQGWLSLGLWRGCSASYIGSVNLYTAIVSGGSWSIGEPSAGLTAGGAMGVIAVVAGVAAIAVYGSFMTRPSRALKLASALMFFFTAATTISMFAAFE